jgi:hypothetical protein
MPASVTIEGNFACYRPLGEHTLAEVTAGVADAIRWCRKQQIRALLADLTGADFPRPTIAERFEFISRWADLAGPSVRIAVCAKPEMILEDKFGVLIATNRGMIADAFDDLDSARTWINSHNG